MEYSHTQYKVQPITRNYRLLFGKSLLIFHRKIHKYNAAQSTRRYKATKKTKRAKWIRKMKRTMKKNPVVAAGIEKKKKLEHI